MLRITAVFLILLRLAIGWHFLFEGLNKVQSTYTGPTETVAGKKAPFSSAGFFREANGPLGRVFRWGIGDANQEALARLTVQPIPADQDPATYPPYQRVPPLLHEEWSDYVKRFESHYGLDEEQRALAEVKLKQAEEQVVLWLTAGRKEVQKTYPTGVVPETLSTPDRIAEYKAKLETLRDTMERKLPILGRDVEGPRLTQLKAEVNQLRAGLLADLNERIPSSTDVSTAVGLGSSPGVGPLLAGYEVRSGQSDLKKSLDSLLTADQRKKGTMPLPTTGRFLSWLDWGTRWGLTVIGACLMIGLLTRLNCVLAAGFLLMTYLSAPSFPWLPVPLQNEGNYVYINKNVIEFLALLVLATTASGRWFGVDGLISGCIGLFRKRHTEELATDGTRIKHR
jgi:uncharacterized membrane protein YphA (DoxX/SURF4 family)